MVNNKGTNQKIVQLTKHLNYVVSEVNDYVTVVYNTKFYIDRAIKIDDKVEKF